MRDIGASIHVMPEDDILYHHQSPACPCVPKIERQGTTCHCTGNLYVRIVTVHNAMDSRE